MRTGRFNARSNPGVQGRRVERLLLKAFYRRKMSVLVTIRGWCLYHSEYLQSWWWLELARIVSGNGCEYAVAQDVQEK
jgi:hypothetical protein